MPKANHIVIEFDQETQGFYIIWRPIIIGSGKTTHESLENLRETAHFAIDTFIARELMRIRTDEESLE